MKTFCKSLKKHAKSIIDFEKENMLLLTKEELKSYQDARNCYICGGTILRKLSKGINYQKVNNHRHYTGTYRGTAHSTCNLKLTVSNEIAVVFLTVQVVIIISL